MGRYFNPPHKVSEVGRKLNGGTYAEITAQLYSDELLVGLYDRYVFQNAPHLFSANEFDVFEEQVKTGVVQRIGFFAVKQADFDVTGGL